MLALVTGGMLFIIGLYWTWSLVCLARHLATTKPIDLPVVWSPVTASNPFWIFFGKQLATLLGKLPFGLGEWTKYTTIDWHWIDRTSGDLEVHKRYGDTFVQATPSGIDLHTRDPWVAQQVLKNLPKTGRVSGMLEIFGPNLVSSNEEDWNRHRKITVATLSDSNNRIIWIETARQARQMIEHYTLRPGGVMTDLVEATGKLYLHVIASVGFGEQYDFGAPGEHGSIPSGHSRTYKDVLSTALKDIFRMGLIPAWVSRLPVALMPPSIREFHEAVREMHQYLDEMIERSKDDAKGRRNETSTSNLLDTMIRKSEGINSERFYLTESEVRGNLFIYSVGGHESNSHTLHYALYLLAAYPQVQAWVDEELHVLFPDKAGVGPSFDAFPRMTRCLAVMVSIESQWPERMLTALQYETLRLYPSIIFLPRTTGKQPALIKCNDGEVILPKNTNVWVNMAGMQVDEQLWGADAKLWRPSRWISPSSTGPGGEQLQRRLDGAFVAWSDGKRVCPGQRFSQVAFAASLATLLYEHDLCIVPNEGETSIEARQRTLRVLEDSFVSTTICMHDPASVRIKLEKRDTLVPRPDT